MQECRNTIFLLCVLIASGLLLTSCATVEYPSSVSKKPPLAVADSTQRPQGIYHRVEKGQTLWRISKKYGVELDEIIRSNRITDSTQVNSGRLLFIPGGQRQAASSGGHSFRAQDFIWPNKGKVVSGFGDKASNAVNRGITLRTASGATVIASASGIVVFVNEELKGYGKTVIISHEGGLMTIYAMLSQILVQPGERINQGMPIARCAHGIMHFEIRKGHIPQNPYHYLAS